MKFTKAAMLLVTVISASSTAVAGTPIRLARERFSNSKAIKLDLESQEQLNKGDVENAERSVNLALQEDPELWLTYFMRARIFMRQHKYELTIQDCNWVLRKYPKFIEAALLRVEANAELGKYAASLNELDHVVRIRPNLESYARALRERAWFRSSCPDASFRDGNQAIADAKLACKLTNWKDATSIDGLAMAYAEIGDFDSAMPYEEQAIGLADPSNLELKRCQRHLALFKQRQPVRM
jgi:tetratricopeptide (TPR) repeat protein